METLQRFNTTLMCSVYADQSVPLWLKDSKLNVTYFSDNHRLIHKPTVQKVKDALYKDGFCDRYLGVHRAYPKYMREYWRVLKKSEEEKLKSSEKSKNYDISRYSVPAIRNFSEICNISRELDWKEFGGMYRYPPRLCRKWTPKWASNMQFIGRIDPT